MDVTSPRYRDVGTFVVPIEVGDPSGERFVGIGDRQEPTLVVFGEGEQPLLGAITLEAFLLGVDPVERRLVPVPGLLMRIAA